ncbi:hypothetical protein MRB53_018242 [Persea americana]|uniref:Uncharacterized protein n=1 Tax=Persea americana TaxID=3435 RepID=A0ACC2M7W7_PERAE|nr:hypothetical protein MRB53_018242 [Persea americana]
MTKPTIESATGLVQVTKGAHVERKVSINHGVQDISTNPCTSLSVLSQACKGFVQPKNLSSLIIFSEVAEWVLQLLMVVSYLSV